MSAWSYALPILLVLVAAHVVVRFIVALRVVLKFRGKRLVTCPETEKAAAVRVAAVHAGARALAGGRSLRLSKCSRWPGRQDCGQQCLDQITAVPEDCLVWNIVARWYQGKSCIYCGKPFGAMKHLDRRPALMGPDMKTVEWNEIPAEKLPEVLSTDRPVCWSCHITQTFIREHPDLITYRPWERGPLGEYVCRPEHAAKDEEEPRRRVTRN